MSRQRFILHNKLGGEKVVRFKVLVGGLIALVLMTGATPAFADFQPIAPGTTSAQEVLKAKVATTHGAPVSGIGPGNYIVGFSFAATTASAWCVLYDSSSSVSSSNSVIIGEAMEATQHESKEVTLPQPYKLINGLTVDFIDTTTVIVYYY
jgi:hypothetical protein